VSSGLPARSHAQPLPPIPKSPAAMSLSRSPSPLPGGGWASPGLTSGRSSPSKRSYGDLNGGINNVSWASAKAKSDEVNGYPSFSIRSDNFFGRHARRLSHSLPRFNLGRRRSYAEKEKLGRGRWRWMGSGTRLGKLMTLVARRARLRLLLLIGFAIALIVFYISCKPLSP
jgi:mannan polymerase II complex MNN10 subunit